MLKTVTGEDGATGGRYAIVASEYNARYVDGMLAAAQARLEAARAEEVRVVRVPGAFEIPVAAAALARAKAGFDAILCLGVVLRGATTHAQHISETVSYLLGALQVETGTPVIHEVLLLENREQAEARCLAPETNRGAEAASTALKMAKIMKDLAK